MALLTPDIQTLQFEPFLPFGSGRFQPARVSRARDGVVIGTIHYYALDQHFAFEPDTNRPLDAASLIAIVGELVIRNSYLASPATIGARS